MEQDLNTLQTVTPMLIERDPAGKFLSRPEGSGRKPGTRNAVTKKMMEELGARIGEGVAGENGVSPNPLVCMHQIMLTTKSESVRLAAATRLTQFLLPKLLSIGLDPTDENFEFETQRITETLRGYFARKED
jgi:hypothetical protein